MYAFITLYLFSQIYDSALFNTEFIGIAQKQIRS